MPTANGIFVLDADLPTEVDGKKSQTVRLMFVFEIDPIDIGGVVRFRLTPAHRDGDVDKEWLLPESAQILIPQKAPHIIAALDAGEAIFQMIMVPMAWPIRVSKERAALEILWHQIYQTGQKTIATERFKLAGTWVEFDPDTPPVMPDP